MSHQPVWTAYLKDGRIITDDGDLSVDPFLDQIVRFQIGNISWEPTEDQRIVFRRRVSTTYGNILGVQLVVGLLNSDGRCQLAYHDGQTMVIRDGSTDIKWSEAEKVILA